MNGLDPASQAPVPPAGGQRLPRAYRLDPAGYKSTFDGGESLASRFFAMWILRSPEGGVGRVGTVASKRTFHDAVQRNRARRRIRETYRLNEHRLKRGYDIVIVARSQSVNGDFAAMQQSFLRQCKKLKLLREEEA